uniref:Serine protease n=1 Tax=Streptomyces thioluteus TaxID=66431 RepID=A0A2H4T9D2_STRTU|nr:serine protease [Streptomyces thioluteus]
MAALTVGATSAVLPPAHAAEAETYALTVRHLDRAGRSTGAYETTVTGISGPGADRKVKPHGDSGTTTVRLPKGRYMLDSYLFGKVADGADWIVQPRLDLDRNTTVTVDARTTARVDVRPPDRSADFLQGAMFVEVTHGGTTRFANRLTGTGNLRVAHLGPAAEPGSVRQSYNAYWTTGTATYALGHTATGARALTGLTRRPAAKDLGTIRVRGAARPGTGGRASVDLQPSTGPAIGAARRMPVPGTTTFFVAPERGPWDVTYWAPTAPGEPANRYSAARVAVRAGATTTLAFDHAVFGPALTGRHGVTRNGDRLAVDVPLLADGGGHVPSAPAYDTASTTLYREGKVVGTRSGAPGRAAFTVPPGRAAYRLTSTAQRKGAAGTATRVTASWTFTSGRTAGTAPVPVSVVRFSPRIGPDGTAAAGSELRVPVTVMGAAAGGHTRSPKVSVSMDGGTSWTRVPVEDGAVTVRNPRAGTGVSLRAELTDTAGNTLTQTLVDAYRTK